MLDLAGELLLQFDAFEMFIVALNELVVTFAQLNEDEASA